MNEETSKIADIEARANDIITSLSKQRDGAMNSIVQLESALAAKERELTKAKQKIAELEAAGEDLPKANGVANGMAEATAH